MGRTWVALERVARHRRLIDSCITHLKAQGPSRICNESREEEEGRVADLGVALERVARRAGRAEKMQKALPRS